MVEVNVLLAVVPDTLSVYVRVFVPTPKFVPSNVSADPLVATLLPFKYNTPLAVPPERVGLLVSVRSVRLPVVIFAVVALAVVATTVVALTVVILPVVAITVVALTVPTLAVVTLTLVIVTLPLEMVTFANVMLLSVVTVLPS